MWPIENEAKRASQSRPMCFPHTNGNVSKTFGAPRDLRRKSSDKVYARQSQIQLVFLSLFVSHTHLNSSLPYQCTFVRKSKAMVWFLYVANPQQGDLRLSDPPSGQRAGGGTRAPTARSMQISGRISYPLHHRCPSEAMTQLVCVRCSRAVGV
ncbi:hypothetical protein PoB_006016400 [Plakobranchus ocellatus]|uniref:Uncharacterized protein n=1 Tax=Plakobranchus ocellatus TaxID=259542 RepID=A0AAV4CP72_9GAST|nr:hypothetical protein PoB_006016400 [Plakobranchus ocellatus]